MKKHMHTNFSDILRSEISNQSNGFLNTRTHEYHRSHVETARYFSNAYRIEDTGPFPSGTEYILLPQRRFCKNLPNIQKTYQEGASACNKCPSCELFGVYQKDIPSVMSKLMARNSEKAFGRKKGRKKEGKKETGWLYWPRWFCAIGLRPTIYFVALEEIAIASALLRGSLVFAGPLARGYVPWPFAVSATKPVYVSIHAPTTIAFASVCANGVGGSVSAGALR